MNKIGALTSKVYAFKARPWEVKLRKTIDITSSLCTPIVAEIKSNKILRCTPNYSKDLKLEWCGDIARYVHESNDIHRLDDVYSKDNKNNYQKIIANIDKSLVFDASIISFNIIDIVFGVNLDIRGMFDLKYYGRRMGGDIHCEFVNKLSKTFSSCYSITRKLVDIDKSFSLFLFGLSPIMEATNANLLYRLRFLKGNFETLSFGNALSLSYSVKNYGSMSQGMLKLTKGQNLLNQKLKPGAFYAYGDTLSQRQDANSLQKIIGYSHKDNFRGLVCHSTGVNAYGAMHLGHYDWKEYNNTYFVYPQKSKSFELAKFNSILCETPYLDNSIKKSTILYPIITYLEKNTKYMRYDGLVQRAYIAVNSSLSQGQNLNNLCKSIKKTFRFARYKGARVNRFILSCISHGVFLKCIKHTKKLKHNNTCIKSFYGNIYTSSLFMTRSTTLHNLSKAKSLSYWSFI